ncbi:uncharacterized protein troap [Lampris incognitus]|uniref:uncharacterized protein troap n=1 Tax=Lampris incognitus TaxID=2546036 RepID=UPI0024B51FA3|nr:uncharacterized protein troap [Lampris incognitus]
MIIQYTAKNVSHSGQKEEINGSREEVGEVNRKGEEEEQEQKNIGSQLFFQAPHRESVILFSTGKKLFKVPCFETVENSVQQEQRSTVLAVQRMEQHGTVLAAQRLQLPINEEYPSGSEPAWQDNPSILSLPRDFFVPKNCAHSPAMALLRKRLPPVEELRLDAEVATYASRPAPAPPTLQPPRPRCGNPLAFILHFQESTTFVPIDCGPASPSASALPDNICMMGSFS